MNDPKTKIVVRVGDIEATFQGGQWTDSAPVVLELLTSLTPEPETHAHAREVVGEVIAALASSFDIVTSIVSVVTEEADWLPLPEGMIA